MPLLLAATEACSHSESSDSQQQAADTVVTTQAPLELPMPEIPDSMATPDGRVDYILQHFWDPMDWSDTTRSRNTDFIEQNFVNYVTFFRIAKAESVEKSVSSLLRNVAPQKKAMALLMETAEKYLYEPDSPMLDEEYFEIFLKAAQATGQLEQYERERSRFLLDEIAKNRCGSIAADFSFTDTRGNSGTLRALCKKTPLTLVIFYEPDCETCAFTIASLSSDRQIASLTGERKLAILTLYPGDDSGLWQAKQHMIPDTWHNAMAAGTEFSSHELYSFRAMPTLYLLDSSARVLAKDLPAAALPALLSQHAPRP